MAGGGKCGKINEKNFRQLESEKSVGDKINSEDDKLKM